MREDAGACVRAGEGGRRGAGGNTEHPLLSPVPARDRTCMQSFLNDNGAVVAVMQAGVAVAFDLVQRPTAGCRSNPCGRHNIPARTHVATTSTTVGVG